MDEKIAVMEKQIQSLTGAAPSRTSVADSIEEPINPSTSLQETPPNSSPRHAKKNQTAQRPSGRYDDPSATSNTFPFNASRLSLPNTSSQPDLDMSASRSANPTLIPPTTSSLALSLMSPTEMNRLINLYEDETGSIYRFLDITQVQSRARNLSDRNRAASRDVLSDPDIHEYWDNDSDILKMVIAIALAIEGCGYSEMGRKLFGEVQLSIDTGVTATKADIRSLKLLALMVLIPAWPLNEADL